MHIVNLTPWHTRTRTHTHTTNGGYKYKMLNCVCVYIKYKDILTPSSIAAEQNMEWYRTE